MVKRGLAMGFRLVPAQVMKGDHNSRSEYDRSGVRQRADTTPSTRLG